MRKKRPSAHGKPISDKIIAEIEELHRRLNVVYCTATCIQLALTNGLEDADRDVGICVERHVVDELYQIGEQLSFILTELRGGPASTGIET